MFLKIDEGGRAWVDPWSVTAVLEEPDKPGWSAVLCNDAHHILKVHNTPAAIVELLDKAMAVEDERAKAATFVEEVLSGGPV